MVTVEDGEAATAAVEAEEEEVLAAAEVVVAAVEAVAVVGDAFLGPAFKGVSEDFHKVRLTTAFLDLRCQYLPQHLYNRGDDGIVWGIELSA